MTLNLGRTLKQHFGYSDFRPLQEAIIQDALAGREPVDDHPGAGLARDPKHLGLDAVTRLFGYFPGSRLGFGEDVYLVLGDFARDGSEATVKLQVNRLVSWIWIGGAVLAGST